MTKERAAYEGLATQWIAMSDEEKDAPEGDALLEKLDFAWWAMTDEDIADIQSGGPPADGAQPEASSCLSPVGRVGRQAGE